MACVKSREKDNNLVCSLFFCSGLDPRNLLSLPTYLAMEYCVFMYCIILINLAHPCECDMLDQFGTLAQVGHDHDNLKISALMRVQKCYFAALDTKIGAAEGHKSKNA